jgi:putative endonuclease
MAGRQSQLDGRVQERECVRERVPEQECARAQAQGQAPPGARARPNGKERRSGQKQPSVRKQLGDRGEDIACQFLEGRGAQVVERNWRCQAGEADVIAREGGDLVFVEVKTRRSDSAGFPEDAVDHEKRRRYEKIAMEYLFSHDLPSARVRFDVIALLLSGDNKAFLRHHRDAYGTGD